MRVLVACEFSGMVRDAFRRRGHNAWSCDFDSALTGAEFHFQGDVEKVLGLGWDLLIGHPPCTYLAQSGVHLLMHEPGRKRRAEAGAAFFRKLLNAPIERICVENPVPHKFAVERIGQGYTQIVHPWEFGHMEQKPTCLWLKNLPQLQPTRVVYADMMLIPEKERLRINWLPDSAARPKLRSITYAGLAEAMAEQWG